MAASQGNVGRHAQADLRLRRTGGACELRDVCRAEATAKERIQRSTARRQGHAAGAVVDPSEFISGAAARRKMLRDLSLQLQCL